MRSCGRSKRIVRLFSPAVVVEQHGAPASRPLHPDDLPARSAPAPEGAEPAREHETEPAHEAKAAYISGCSASASG